LISFTRELLPLFQKKKKMRKEKNQETWEAISKRDSNDYHAMSNAIRTTILFIVLACMAVKKFSAL
jgi:hypothetical protein